MKFPEPGGDSIGPGLFRTRVTIPWDTPDGAGQLIRYVDGSRTLYPPNWSL